MLRRFHNTGIFELDKEISALARDDEDEGPVGLDRRLEMVGRAFQVPHFFPLLKKVLNLVAVSEMVKFPRAIGRFINQEAAVVSDPQCQWTAIFAENSFVAQFTFSDLVGAY